jgi:hypothetical protein
MLLRVRPFRERDPERLGPSQREARPADLRHPHEPLIIAHDQDLVRKRFDDPGQRLSTHSFGGKLTLFDGFSQLVCVVEPIFDPLHGNSWIRLSFAGSTEELANNEAIISQNLGIFHAH